MINKRLTNILIGGVVILLSGCTCRYEVTQDSIRSNCEMWALSIHKIDVYALNEKGVPVDYAVTMTITAGQRGDHDLSGEVLREMSDVKGFDLQQYGFKWKPQKKISFKKRNKYFFWETRNPYQQHDILPLQFGPGDWYLIKRFEDTSQGGGKFNIFVHINAKGELIQLNDILPGPF